MKTALTFPVLLLSLSLSNAASEDKLKPIPKEKEGRWGLYTFEEAKEEAARKKQPLAILVVDERSEENSVKEAGEVAFWNLSKDASMVVILSNLLGSGKGRLGDYIYGALTSAELGKGMPRLIVTTPTADVILGQLTAEQLIAADDRSLKDFGRQMELSNRKPPARPAGGPVIATSSSVSTTVADGPVTIRGTQNESWTNSEGVTIQATLVEAHPDKVVFLMNGQKIDYPLAKLNDASRERVAALKAASLQ